MAGVELATAYVQLQPSFRGLSGAIDKEFGGEFAKRGDKDGKAYSKTFASAADMKDFGKKALIGAGLLTAGILKTADAAGDLSAAMSASDQVFGDASATIKSFGDDSVRAVGLSKRATLEAAVGFGLFGEKAGLAGEDLADFSVGLIKVAADMAAFKNVPTTQAVEDLQAAFAGSTETLNKYGIDARETTLKQILLAETGQKVTGVMTNAQRATALYAAIMQQSSTMTGQWNRELGELNSQQSMAKAAAEDAAASIGRTFVPVAATAFQLVAEGATGFAELNDATGGAIAELTLVGTGLLGMAGSASFAVGKMRDVSRAFGEWPSLAKSATLGFGAAATALAIGYTIWSTKQQQARQRVEEAASALRDQTAAALDNADAVRAAGGEVDTLAAANDALALAITTTGENGEKLTKLLGSIGVNAADAADGLVALQDDPIEGFRLLAEAAGLSGDQLEAVAQAAASMDSIEFLTNAQWDELGASIGITGAQAKALNEESGNLAQTFYQIAQATDAVALDDVAREWMNSAIGNGEISAALVEQAEATAGVSREGEGAAQVYQALIGILADVPAGMREAGSEAGLLAGAFVGLEASTQTTGEAVEDTTESVDVIEEAFGEASDAADIFTDALDRLIGVNNDAAAAQDDLAAALDELFAATVAAKESTDAGAQSLTANTAAARQNREAFRDTAQSALDYAAATINAGGSAAEATAAVNSARSALVAQAKQYGMTDAEAAAYINTLLGTPEEVQTALELAQVDQSRAEIASHKSDLASIPGEENTDIKVQASGLPGVESAIDRAARNRTATIYTRYSSGGGPARYAIGGYSKGAEEMLWGEDGPEVILPLTNEQRMRELLADPRGAPIREAVLATVNTNVTTTTTGGSTGVATMPGDVTMVNIEEFNAVDGTGPAQIAFAVQRAVRAAG